MQKHVGVMEDSSIVYIISAFSCFTSENLIKMHRMNNFKVYSLIYISTCCCQI